MSSLHSSLHSHSSTGDLSSIIERSVTFSTVEFHEHAMIMGDTPSCTDGPPLEIDWAPINQSMVDLDDYEEDRPPRRVKGQLRMPGDIREEVLLESGYTRNQIHADLRRREQERRASAGKLSLKKLAPIRMLAKARRKFSGIVGGRMCGNV